MPNWIAAVGLSAICCPRSARVCFRKDRFLTPRSAFITDTHPRTWVIHMSLHLPKPSSIVRPQNEDVQMSSAPNETTHNIPQPRLSTSPSTSASSSHWFSKLPSLQQQQHQLQQRSETGPSSASLTSQLARQAARELRQERANAAGRSPFVPKKVQQGHGHGHAHAHAHGHLTSSGKGKGRALDHEEEDHLARTALSQMSLEELEQRLERSSDLLNSP